MSASTATEKLNTGATIPTLGLGTWKSEPGAVEHAVEYALRNGYKHIDTAAAYGNEQEVGNGIKASGVARESFFLTTKLNNPDHGRAEEALEDSLKKLQTPYLDLWLMHWPAPMTVDGKADKSRDWIDGWKAMIAVYKAHPEKVKAIGVSNVSIEFMERLFKETDVIPAANQIEMHPSCPQTELVEFCRSKNIHVTAFSPLGSNDSPLLENPVVTKLAAKYKVQPANILVSLQHGKPGVSVLAKSVSNARIANNLNVVDLTAEETAELDAVDKTAHFRVCEPNWTGWGKLGFPDAKE